MPAPALIHELVERFDRNRDAYRSGQYNETQARREFIDPFFEALGWDVNNRQGYAEAYKDVIHEDAIKIGGATKAPDYCFRIGGTRKFFVEAKKPSVKLRDDISAAFQLRRYAWSAKLPLSLLTDFDEFAIYDCRGKPDKSDKPSSGRVLMLDYGDYLARWDEIAGIFSREAILRGSFDKYAESVTGKHGTAAVDDAFLREIEGWRDTLARTIALRNPALSQRALNTAVQATIDRIVFLRICEDRGIEGYGTLLALTNGGDVYARLADLFRQADARYNSGLFHFAAEGDRPETPDAWTLGLAIDDKPLREILRGLYYPDSPYEFAVLPADILGQVYEQFLGQVIRLTPGHRAVVEAKPEVKKAGGVFYTPTFIVRVIVRRTVGPLLAGKTVREVAGRGGVTPPLRIADIACGSGTFLLEVYQHLLDWYLAQYVAHLAPLLLAGHAATSGEVRALLPDSEPAPAGKRARKTDGALPIYEAAGGEWRLTTAERKRILTTHIYGVDIDPQAVEVTKLSLLLKVLEGENEQTLGSQLRLFQERALPDLARNIKCGNSLIGPEFQDGEQLGLLDDEARYRINAFDWAAEFPEVFADGNGFDAIVGNPPYIRIQTMKEWAPLEVEYYKRAYAAAGKGNYDIYVVFVERALNLLNPRGRLGFILPHKFFNAQYGEPLRKLLAGGRHLAEVVHFGDQQVFHAATTYTCLLFLDRAGRDEFRFERVADLAAWREAREVDPTGLADLAGLAAASDAPILADRATSAEWNFTTVDYEATLDQTVSLREALPASHLARFVVDLVAQLDLGLIYAGYAARGGIAYAPEILLALLFYGYATGVFSSRRIEKATYEMLPFRFIAGGLHPDHDTLANFRKTFLPLIKELFVQMLLLAQAAGYLELGNLSLDGTKVHANASKSKAVSYKRLVELEVQLRAEVDALFRLAEQADQPVPAGMVIADEIAIRQERLTRLAAAKTVLAARAQDRYTAEKAAYDAKLRSRTEKTELTGRQPGGRAPAPPVAGPQDTDQYNFTDPESRIMKNANNAGFEQAYNAQAAVDQASRFIVACSLSNHANDKAEVAPTLAALAPELGTPPAAALDNGFWSEQNIAALEQRQIEPYIATGREPHHQSWQARFAGEPEPPPADASSQVKMAYKLHTAAGQAIYRLRKCTVEPVFGIVKAVLGFRQFLLRGLAAASDEWCLMCLAYNIKRYHTLSLG